ncbi:DNA topology modulation protein [Paenibacillus guangzhouensis]|uniref:DNA topology modulation protein n=1 Tax=Paenibacillus guangzhouensis TaxID=1473112 RepID=UPI001266CB02|nr:DNA topology modulation protein [Paenibacillus guangzhouensis]
MNRILIIGSPGSGKSTFSQVVGDILSLPVIHLDRYYWKPNWVSTPKEEWEQFLMDIAGQDQWIIDGNYNGTLDLRLRYADTVIFLDMPRLLCIYRILKRRIQYHGKTRPDLNEACPERLDGSFFRWVWNYNKHTRQQVLQRLEQLDPNKRVFVLKSRREVSAFIDQLTYDREKRN